MGSPAICLASGQLQSVRIPNDCRIQYFVNVNAMAMEWVCLSDLAHQPAGRERADVRIERLALCLERREQRVGQGATGF